MSPPLQPGSRYAYSSSDLRAAISDNEVSRIVLVAGTYELTSDMCTGSAVCINRALTIEAEVPGTVVLNAMGGRRVFLIQSYGTAELVGLNIAGGKATGLVRSACLFEPSVTYIPSPAGTLRVCMVCSSVEVDSLSKARQR